MKGRLGPPGGTYLREGAAVVLLVGGVAVWSCARGPSQAAYAKAVRDSRADETSGADEAAEAGDPPATRSDDTSPAARPAKVLVGRASYYADSLAGHPTASGEPYDPDAFTGANRDLPFGTRVRVVRVDDGRSVVVRINDRGPFGRKKRILDVSRAAAEKLGMIREGVIDVRVEVLKQQD